MALSRTWYDNVNVALADTSTALRSHASMWHNFLKQMTGATTGNSGANGAPPGSSYWTVHSSHACGVGAGSGNNFSSTFTASEWLRAAAASTHAWFVLQSPATTTDGPWYILVSLGTSSDQNAIVALSKVAFSGGTTTADPTATNQVTYTSFQVHPNTTTAGKTHLVVDANGNFFFYSGKNSAGYCNFCVIGQTLTEARSSGDSGRFAIFCSYLDSGRGVPNLITGSSTTGRQLSPTATATTAGDVATVSNLTINGFSYNTAMATANLVDSKVDALPVYYVYLKTAGNVGVRGRIPDMWLVGAAASVGAGDPSSAAPTRIVMGEALVPMGYAPGL